MAETRFLKSPPCVFKRGEDVKGAYGLKYLEIGWWVIMALVDCSG